MQELFINKIRILEVRHLHDIDIDLAYNKKTHLIVTGKNGSGKTSFLIQLKQYLSQIVSGKLSVYKENTIRLNSDREKLAALFEKRDMGLDVQPLIDTLTSSIQRWERWLESFGGLSVEFNDQDKIIKSYDSGNFILTFFDAKRNTAYNTPTGINQIDYKLKYGLDQHINTFFIQYIVNLVADRSFLRDENDKASVKQIDEWFKTFEYSLNQLIGNKVTLKFDRKTYNFIIQEEGKNDYDFNKLSDGYASILSIVSELIIRMDKMQLKNYNVQGIVLIDEIETHLHIDLQKKVLPFLTSFFPQVQFIVTTHSPFVLSSIENAVVCDLENKIVVHDLSAYSYKALVECYFDTDSYSIIVKQKIEDYEILKAKAKLSAIENETLSDLLRYFNSLPMFLSDELAIKLQQIKLENMKVK